MKLTQFQKVSHSNRELNEGFPNLRADSSGRRMIDYLTHNHDRNWLDSIS